MEKHHEKLSGICRLCACKIKSEGNYKDAKLASDPEFSCKIKALFDYYITDEDETINPSHLCSKCVKKLRKVKLQRTYSRVELVHISLKLGQNYQQAETSHRSH